MPTTYIPGAGYYDSGYLGGMGGYGSTYGVPTTQMGGLTPQMAQGLASGALANVSGQRTGAGPQGAAEQAAIAFLNDVLGGKKAPFDQATQANMLSQASDMTGAAEAGQLSAINEDAAVGGASIGDPSLAGARREAMARRQGGNAQAAQGIATQANRANFGAQMQAAGTLADYGLAQQDRQARQQAAFAASLGSGGGGGGPVGGGMSSARSGSGFQDWSTNYDPARQQYTYQGQALDRGGNTATGWSYDQARQAQQQRQTSAQRGRQMTGPNGERIGSY